jgi:DNA-binding NarL/FixJ family response regulator
LISRLKPILVTDTIIKYCTIEDKVTIHLRLNPSLAFIDIHSEEFATGFRVLRQIRKKCPSTHCVVMSHTGQDNIKWIVKSEMLGAIFVNKDILLRDDREDNLQNFVKYVIDPNPSKWERYLRKTLAENLHDEWLSKGDDVTKSELENDVFSKPLFAPREKDYISCYVSRPLRIPSNREIRDGMDKGKGKGKGKGKDKDVRDFTRRVCKKIMFDLGWWQNGVVTEDGKEPLVDAGFMEKGEVKPNFTRKLVYFLLQKIGYI